MLDFAIAVARRLGMHQVCWLLWGFQLQREAGVQVVFGDMQDSDLQRLRPWDRHAARQGLKMIKGGKDE